jgi:TonB family protein
MMRPKTLASILLLTISVATLAHGQNETGPASGPPADGPQNQTTPSHPMRIRVGGNVAGAKLVHSVQPTYPADAKAKGISGTVVLHAVIGKDGTVRKLEYVSGPPELQQAAIDAVQQWRYEPTLLNGQPVEVDTKINVVFDLDPGSAGQRPAPTGSGAESAQPKSESTAIDPQLRADILHLLEVIHVRDKTTQVARTMFDSLRPTILSSLPPTARREEIADAYEDKLVNLLSGQDFIDAEVAEYAKYLSDDDIKGMIDFYTTPAGQHFNAVQSDLVAGGMQIGQDLARKKIPEIMRSLCSEFPELKGAAGFCPAQKSPPTGQ